MSSSLARAQRWQMELVSLREAVAELVGVVDLLDEVGAEADGQDPVLSAVEDEPACRKPARSSVRRQLNAGTRTAH